MIKSNVKIIKEGSIVLLENGERALWFLNELTAITYSKQGSVREIYRFSENDKLHILRTPLQVGSQYLIDNQRKICRLSQFSCRLSCFSLFLKIPY